MPATTAVARMWGRLFARFQDQVGENDMWIAASALAQVEALPVVTNNLRHFQPIAREFGLQLIHPDL